MALLNLKDDDLDRREEGCGLHDHHIDINNKAICFWSWNGDIEDDEICRQLAEFADGRFDGVVIHARAGLRIPYMDEKWFHAFRLAVEECRRLGLHILLYDEDGWPSGFAAGKIPALGDEYCFKRLTYGTDPEQVGERLAAFRKNGPNQYARIPLEKAAPGDLFFGYVVDRHYVDLLYPDTTQKFIELVYQRYADEVGDAFGEVIKGIFTDEPQLNCAGYPWSVSLPKAFSDTYGCSLLDNLWLLVEEGEHYQQFRRDFWQLVGDLFQRYFTYPISEWCQKNNIAFTGHFACEDGLCDQISSCGGVMEHYALMQLPGIDHLGSRITSPVLSKQVSSVSRQFNGGQVLSETFGCSGWGVTFSRLAWIWGWQSVLGVTKPCFHLAAYSIEGRRKRDYPAFFSYQEPWWKEFKQFNQWIEHHNQLMAEGDRICRVLIIPPTGVMMEEYRDAFSNREKNIYSSAQFRLLVENLLDLQVDFELGDEKLLERYAVIQDGQIHLGHGRYDWVFVAENGSLKSTTSALLDQLKEQNGHVAYINKLPYGVQLNGPRCQLVQNRREAIEKYLQYADFPREVSLYNPSGTALASGMVLHTRAVGDHRRIHIWNASFEQKQELLLKLNAAASVAHLLPDGKRQLLPSHVSKDGNTYVSLSICGGENFVLETAELQQSYETPVLLSREAVTLSEVSLTDKNCLTLDYAAFAFGEEPFSEEMPVLHIIDKLYENTASSAEIVRLRYSFYCKEVSDGIHPTLAVEDRECMDIQCNGKSVLSRRIGWWIDRHIGEYDIDGAMQAGENEIILTYRLPKSENTVEVGKVFETERNRFFYPLEPDNIYIRGNFDVNTTGQIKWKPNYYAVSGGRFYIDRLSPKHPGDFTPQGLWFYRGGCSCTFTVKGQKGVKTCLSIKDFKAVAVEWKTEYGSGLLFQPPFEVDLTDFISSDQETVVTLRLVGNNRNLMGPHHHINGENIMVGPSTFQGHKGFEDFVSPWVQDADTWTDDYAVIPLDIGTVQINRYRMKLCHPLELTENA